jgi:hypothetical protein
MSYIKTKYSRGVVSLLSDLPNLANPIQGETAFCSENGRLMTYDGQLWMCDDFIKLTNASGGTRSVGDIMIFQDTSGTTLEAKVVNTLGNEQVAGVVVYQSLSNQPVALAYKGIYKIKIDNFVVAPTFSGLLICQAGTYTAAARASNNVVAGNFAWTVETFLGPTPVPANILLKCLIRSKVEVS